MRIVSKFTDFYDHAMAFGVESDLIYVRKTENVIIPYKEQNHATIGPYNDTLNYIGFAGKIYPFVYYCTSRGQRKYFYLYKEWKNARGTGQVKNWIKRTFEEYRKSSIQRDYDKWQNGISQKEPSVAKWFDKAPVFVYYKDEVVLNPCLRPLEFFRIFDPYTAYQELFMYLSNLARPLKPIPEIDDKTMAEAKGFNKFSFRKDKQNA